MKTVRTNTKKEAMSELAKFQIEVEAGEYISPEKMTLSAFVDEWKEKHASRNLAPSTMKVYMEHIRQHILPKFGHLQINQIRTIQVVTFINDLSKSVSNSKPLSDSTVLYIYKVLKHLITKAVEWRLLQKNPMDKIMQPKVQRKKMNYYDEKEARELIAALSKGPVGWRLYYLGCMLGGFRRGELVGLEWSNVNFEDNSITICKSIPLTLNGQAIEKLPKTDYSIREVDMPAWYMNELRDYRDQWLQEKQLQGDSWLGGDKEYVFHSGNGRPYYYSRPSHNWKVFIRRHQLKEIRLHDLRHSAATLLIEENASLKAIQERLGHSKFEVTAYFYAHVTKKVSRDTANKLEKFNPKNFVPNPSPNDISDQM